MNHFITSAYWQQGHNDSALLLQHYQYGELPLCFACLCPGEGEDRGRAGAYLTERLLVWFRGLSWGRLTRDPEGRLQGLGNKLEETVERAGREMRDRGFLTKQEEPDLTGILCVGEHFLLFGQGSCQIWLLNRCFGRGYIQRIEESSPIRGNGSFLRQGTLQRGIGLLFATESFCSRVTDSELRECLHVETVRTQEQADRHLRELGLRAREQGGSHMGAVLLLTEEDSGTKELKMSKGNMLPLITDISKRADGYAQKGERS